MSAHGIMTVARLELMQRMRGKRWLIALLLWFFTVASVALLSWYAVSHLRFTGGEGELFTRPRLAGITMTDATLFVILGLGMLVMPALTATSINGDREHGVLATMQTTLLTPADMALGRLLAALITIAAFVAVALPSWFGEALRGPFPRCDRCYHWGRCLPCCW